MIEVPNEFFVFTKVNKFQAEELLEAPSPEALRTHIKEVFKLQDSCRVLVDFHYYNLLFCKEQKFSLEKTSGMLTIFEFVLGKAIELRSPRTALEELLLGILKKHSIQRMPRSILVFSYVDLQNIQSYAEKTLLKHYELYEYAFTPQQDISLTTLRKFTGEFPVVPRLEEDDEIDPNGLKVLQEFIVKEILQEEEPQTEEKEDGIHPEDPLYFVQEGLRAYQDSLQSQISVKDKDFLAKLN